MRKFFFALAILCAVSSQAQPNLTPGYILNLSGDSIKGTINYLNWDKNPKSIEFTGTDGAVQSYTPTMIKGFGLFGKDYYTSAIVTKSTRPVDYNQLSSGFFQDTTLTDTVFLRNLVAGDWSLYELVDSKDHYFLQVKGGEISELKYIVEQIDRTNNFGSRNIYRDQLNASILGTPAERAMANRLPQLSYRQGDLKSFVEAINRNNNGKGNALTYDRKRLLHFFVGTGIVYNSISVSGDKEYDLTRLSFTGSVRPSFQAGVDFSSARSLQRFIVRFELGYSNYSVTGKGHVDRSVLERERNLDYELNMNLIKPSLFLMYKVVDLPVASVFLGAGYGENFASYKKNVMKIDYADFSDDTRDPYLDFEKGWGQFAARAGVIVLKKFEASLTYPISGSFNTYNSLNIKPKNLNLQLNYRF